MGSFGKKHIFQAINVKKCAYKLATVSDPSDLALFGKMLLLALFRVNIRPLFKQGLLYPDQHRECIPINPVSRNLKKISIIIKSYLQITNKYFLLFKYVAKVHVIRSHAKEKS